MDKFASKHGSHIEKTANGYRFKMSKKEWHRIGKKAGWLKKANNGQMQQRAEQAKQKLQKAVSILRQLGEDQLAYEARSFEGVLNISENQVTYRGLAVVADRLWRLSAEIRESNAIRGDSPKRIEEAASLVEKVAKTLLDLYDYYEEKADEAASLPPEGSPYWEAG